MAATTLQITVSNGDGSVSVITLPIPANGNPLVLAQSISRIGFWDSAQANYYPPASIRKISPA
jgi:hypothetical protein